MNRKPITQKLPLAFDDAKAWDWFEVGETTNPPEGRMVTVVTILPERVVMTRGILQANGSWRHFDWFERNEIGHDPFFERLGGYRPIPEPEFWSYGTDAWFWKPFDRAGMEIGGATPKDAVAVLASRVESSDRARRSRPRAA